MILLFISPILLWLLLMTPLIFLVLFTGFFLFSGFRIFGNHYYQMTHKYYKVISIERNIAIKVGGYYGKPSNIKWSSRSSFFESINLLVYNPGYTFDKYLDKAGREIRRGTVTVNPKLSIHAGHLEYSVGNQKLSPAELWWLGQELSDFLGLELQIIYPTPKVPPEPSCGGC